MKLETTADEVIASPKASKSFESCRRCIQCILTVTIAGALTGCASSGYGSSNSVQHVYSNDTGLQQSTPPNGIRFEYVATAAERSGAGTAQALTLTKYDVTIFVNQEKIASFNTTRNYSTFVRLPPGIHEVGFKTTNQGVFTLGLKTVSDFEVYQVDLGRGSTGVVRLSPGYSRQDAWTNIDFLDFIRYRFIGACGDSIFNCDPTN